MPDVSGWGTIASIIGALFGIIVLVAAAVAVARASFAKAQIQALRGDRDDLSARVQLLESDNLRISESLRVERDKVAVLEKVVTGKELLEHMQSTLDTHIRADDEWQRQQRALALDLLSILEGRRRDERQEP